MGGRNSTLDPEELGTLAAKNGDTNGCRPDFIHKILNRSNCVSVQDLRVLTFIFCGIVRVCLDNSPTNEGTASIISLLNSLGTNALRTLVRHRTFHTMFPSGVNDMFIPPLRRTTLHPPPIQTDRTRFYIMFGPFNTDSVLCMAEIFLQAICIERPTPLTSYADMDNRCCILLNVVAVLCNILWDNNRQKGDKNSFFQALVMAILVQDANIFAAFVKNALTKGKTEIHLLNEYDNAQFWEWILSTAPGSVVNGRTTHSKKIIIVEHLCGALLKLVNKTAVGQATIFSQNVQSTLFREKIVTALPVNSFDFHNVVVLSTDDIYGLVTRM
jgi:hypothetical protein